MSKRIYVIPDTNVLVQCLPLSDLRWKAVFPKVNEIVVLLTLPVVREIDRQKGGQGRLAKRARAIHSLIGKLIDVPEIVLSKEGEVPSVKVISRDEVKPDPSQKAALDYSQPDDAIIGVASAFQNDHSTEQVILLSNDTGVLLTARRVGVQFRRVPDEWLLPAESDEDQKKIKALEAENARLKNSEPKCVIEPKDDPCNFIVESFSPLSEPQIQSLILRIKRDFPEETEFGPRSSSTRNAVSGLPVFVSLLGRQEFVPATEEEIFKYQHDLYPQWISSCEVYLRELHQRLEKRRPAPRIVIDLLNNGSRPAEDLKVSFAMLGGGLLIQLPVVEDAPNKVSAEVEGPGSSRVKVQDVSLPSPPDAPKGRWKNASPFDTVERMAALSRSIEVRGPIPLARPPFIAPRQEADVFYWKTGTQPEFPRPLMELTCQQWRHRSGASRFEFELAWCDGAKPRKGSLRIEIHAANLTEPVIKVLPVEVMVEAGDTWGESEALIDQLNIASRYFSSTRA